MEQPKSFAEINQKFPAIHYSIVTEVPITTDNANDISKDGPQYIYQTIYLPTLCLHIYKWL